MSDEVTGDQGVPAQGETAPKIEVLYFTECPNYTAAVALVREALASIGIVAPVTMVAVETQDAAEREQFYGSPTIRINGRDVAPHTDPRARPAVACRVYRGPDGGSEPIPSREAIVAALLAR